MKQKEIKTEVSEMLYQKLENEAQSRMESVEDYLKTIIVAWEICKFHCSTN